MVSRRCQHLVVLVPLVVSLVVFDDTPASAAPAIDSFTATLIEAPDRVELSWSTSDATEAYIFGTHDEAGFNHIGFVPTDGTTDVVTGRRMRTYTLAAKDAAGAWRYQSVTTDAVNPPGPIQLTSSNPGTPVTIDYFRSPDLDSPLPDHTITWDLNGATVVKMRRCVGGRNCVDLPNTSGTSYVVDGEDLATVNDDGTFSGLLAPSGQGHVSYELTGCTTRPDGSLFCGETVREHIEVLPAQANANVREYRPLPASDYTVSWDTNGGNWFFVDAPSLGVSNHITGATSYTFTAAQLDSAGEGLHTIRIKSCRAYPGWEFDCASNHPVIVSTAGTVTDLAEVGTSVWPEGTLFAGSIAKVDGVDQRSTRGGNVVSTCECEGQHVAEGTHLATIETFDYSVHQLQLGGEQTWTTTPWTDDFDPTQSEYIQGNTLRNVSPGNDGLTVNGTTILGNGDIYALGEFTTEAVYVAGDTVESRPLPLLHKLNAAGTLFEPVQPFALGGRQHSISNSQDSFKDAAGNIWSTQGWNGGRLPLHNHSRVYRFDPTATDDDLTLQDDRFCSYNVPGDHNDVIGVTRGGGKTWIMESNWSRESTTRLTWFDPSDPAFTNCTAQNTLDYGTEDFPVEEPAFSPGYCEPPQTTNCYNSVEVPASLGAPGHLVHDAAENAIWTSTYSWGGPSALGHYDIATDQWSVYPLPTSNAEREPWLNVGAGGGSQTWEISMSGEYVYINDLTDGDIIRFDKTYAPRSACTELTDGQNPCMSEVHLPSERAWQSIVHGTSLYFTTGHANTETTLLGKPYTNTEPVFGYIDLENWGAITTYTGLDTLVHPQRAHVGLPTYGWFDIDQASGMIAIGQTQLKQWLRLVP